MKWTLEISDVPTNPNYPIKAFYEASPGMKSTEKLFSIEQVINILTLHDNSTNNLSTLREEMITSPILPEGTITYSKHPDGELEQAVFEIPQKTFDIQYKDTGKIYALPFPRMVVACELRSVGNQKLIDTMRIFAVENNKLPITLETPLYDFPYPNVMKGSGTVCWGMNDRVLVDSISEVKKAIFLFFSAPFNEDHGVRTTLGSISFFKLLNDLEEQPYSDEWLLPSNKTFAQMLRESDY